MKYTLTIEADTLEELRDIIERPQAIGVVSTGVQGGYPYTEYAVNKVKNPKSEEDPRAVYGPGNGPVDSAQPIPTIQETIGTPRDSAGVEFNADIHAGEDKTNKDGTWRKKRGASATPATPATPATLPEPGAIMTALATAMQKQAVSVDYVQNLTNEFEMESLADIGHNDELRARVVEKLRADGVL